MPSKASYKKKGGDKDSAQKNSFNPVHEGTPPPQSQTNAPESMNKKNRDANAGGMGEANIIKK